MSNLTHDKVISINDVTKNEQRRRLNRFGLSVATYAVAVLATFLITLLGIGDLSVTQWATLIGLCLFGISLFFGMFYTKINLRFSEPSLTREQIIYSFFYAILVMHWLPEARPIVLLFFLPPFSFGMLSLTLRQYLGVTACVLCLYAALLGLECLQDRQAFMIQYQYQLFLFLLFGLLLTWFAFFGGFVSNIRQRLRTQKEETRKLNEEIKIEIEERKLAQTEKDNMIVELKDALAKIKTLSITDNLTGCYNRHYTSENLDREVSRSLRYKRSISLAMFDIDRFKNVNDTYGHQCGDRILVELVNRVTSGTREKVDWLARYGGDEFLLLMPEAGEKQAFQICQRIRKLVEEMQIECECRVIPITVSIGFTCFNPVETAMSVDAEQLVKVADEALYKAKKTGKNTVAAKKLIE